MTQATRRLGDFLLAWRRVLLPGLIVLALLAGLGVFRLRSEFDPRALLPADEETANAPTEPVLVLLRGDDVLSPPSLRYQHRLATAFERLSDVAAVRGLTTLPLPHGALAGADDLSLDALEAQDEALIDDFADPVTLALGKVLATDPSTFPMGFGSLAERLGGEFQVAPLAVQTDDEAVHARTVIESVRTLRGHLISARGDRAVIALTFERRLSTVEEARVLEGIRNIIANEQAPVGFHIDVGGVMVLRQDLAAALESEQAWLIGLSMLVSTLVLVWGFRRWDVVSIAMAGVGLSVALVLGAMGWLNIPLNLLNNMVAPLLVTIAIGDAVHMVSRFIVEARRAPGRDNAIALRRTLTAVGAACFVTSVTTAVGFASLTLSSTPALVLFGVLAASGVLATFVAVVVGVGLSLAKVPTSDLSIPPPGPATRSLRSSFSARLGRGLTHAAVRGLRGRLWILSSWSLLFILAALAVPTVRVDTALLETLSEDDPAYVFARDLETNLSGFRQFSISLPNRPAATEALEKADRLLAWLETQPLVLRAVSPLDWPRQTWRALTGDDSRDDAVATEARRDALYALLDQTAPSLVEPEFRVFVRDAGAAKTEELLHALHAEMARLDVQGWVHGEAVSASVGLQAVVHELLWSLLITVVVVFAVLGVLFRSPRLALVSIPPNLAPLAAVVLWMSLWDIPFNAATAIVFVVGIGLAVDGTIHVVARYREEWNAHRASWAVVRALRGSATGILLGSASLLAGFTVLHASGFVPIRLFAELSAVAIATALLAELFLLPQLLLWFGRPPRREMSSSESDA